ncbi:MAG: TetR/AcrR family transcriptional regulator [Rhizorhabdus sp.]
MSKKPSTRERILDAAIRLIWRDGYAAVSVDTICEAAGANKGSFYHAFGSKADLLVAAIEQVWQADGSEIRAIYAGSQTATDKFQLHLDWFVQSQRRLQAQHGYVAGHFHMALSVNVPESALALIRAHHEAHQALLLPAIQAVLADRGLNGDGTWLVVLIGLLISGVMAEARLANSLDQVEKLPRLVNDLIDRAR